MVGAGVNPLLQRTPTRTSVPAPHQANPLARRFLDPVAGPIRRLERALSSTLSKRLFTYVPGIDIPYALQLHRQLTVAECAIALAGLPPAFDGVRLLLITDIHSGPFLSPACLLRVFSRLAPLQPDAILLGGDLATNNLGEIERCGEAFSSLRAPLGVFGVLGNHDHYVEDPAQLEKLMEGFGVNMLTNRAVALRRGAARLLLAGVDDWNAGRPDLAAALDQAAALAAAETSSSPPPTVLLSHNPDAFFAAARRGVDLVLSGHTHGGQIRIPRLPVLVRMSRFRLDEGRYTFRGSELVVSRGLGVSGLPLRVACPPEAVLVTLRRRHDPGP